MIFFTSPKKKRDLLLQIVHKKDENRQYVSACDEHFITGWLNDMWADSTCIINQSEPEKRLYDGVKNMTWP